MVQLETDPTRIPHEWALGNSFQKKASLLFGIGNAAEDKNKASGQGGHRQRSEALAALNSAFNSSSGPKSPTTRPSGRSHGGGSQRAAAVAALSSVLSAEKKQGSDSPRAHSRSPHQGDHSSGKGEDEDKNTGNLSPFKNWEDSTPKQEGFQDDDARTVDSIFSYDQLKAKSGNPVTGIDFKRREAYLSAEEFETVFDMSKEAFYKLPKWKQDTKKKKVDLF